MQLLVLLAASILAAVPVLLADELPEESFVIDNSPEEPPRPSKVYYFGFDANSVEEYLHSYPVAREIAERKKLASLMEPFAIFLLHSLTNEGTYNRKLLLSAEIVPPPREFDPPIPDSEKLIDFKILGYIEHFKKHVIELLYCKFRFMDALHMFISKHGDEFILKTEASRIKASPPIKSIENSMHDTDLDSAEQKSQDEMVSAESKLDRSKSLASETSNIDHTQILSEKASTEDNLDRNAGFTTEYIEFLTESLSASRLPNEEGELKAKPFTEQYCTLRKTDSSYSSSCSDEIEQSPTELDDLSEEILTNQLSLETDNHVVITELPSPKEKPSNRVGFITSDLPLQDLKNWLEENSDEDLSKVSHIEFHDIEPKFDSVEHSDFNEASHTEFHETDANVETKYSEEKSSFSRQGKQLNQFVESKNKKGEISPQLYFIPGTPGVEFPNFEDIPDTSFACGNKNHIPGFYADQETNCQAFHVCWPGRRESFLCPLGTIFNQAILACDFWYNSNCSIAVAYYDVNAAFKDSSQTSSTASMVDSLINSSLKETPVEVLTDIKQIDELYEADVHFSETLAKEELSQIWKFLPVKAKVYVEEPPELTEYLARFHKQKRSEVDATTTEVTEPDLTESDFDQDRSPTLKEVIESSLLRVLKNLVSSTKVEVA